MVGDLLVTNLCAKYEHASIEVATALNQRGHRKVANVDREPLGAKSSARLRMLNRRVGASGPGIAEFRNESSSHQEALSGDRWHDRNGGHRSPNSTVCARSAAAPTRADCHCRHRADAARARRRDARCRWIRCAWRSRHLLLRQSATLRRRILRWTNTLMLALSSGTRWRTPRLTNLPRGGVRRSPEGVRDERARR